MGFAQLATASSFFGIALAWPFVIVHFRHRPTILSMQLCKDDKEMRHTFLFCFHYESKVLKFRYAPQWQSWPEDGLSERQDFRPYKFRIATCSMKAAAPYLRYWRGVWIHYSAANLPLNSQSRASRWESVCDERPRLSAARLMPNLNIANSPPQCTHHSYTHTLKLPTHSRTRIFTW